MLQKIGEKINVILASHSPELLTSFYLPRKTKIKSKKTYNEKEWIEMKFAKKEYLVSNLLEYFNSLMVNKIFIVEGSNDYKLIEYLLNTKFWEYSAYISIANGKDTINSKIDIFANIKWNDDERKFSENDIFVLYDKDNKKNYRTSINKCIDHETINSDIEKNLNTNWKHFFEVNLENFFCIKKKKEWDPYLFFQDKEKNKKLNEFIEDKKIKTFLENY